eukprot:SAG31_NODE_7572_length_1651_cov_0.978737_1_plen_68_part_10
MRFCRPTCGLKAKRDLFVVVEALIDVQLSLTVRCGMLRNKIHPFLDRGRQRRRRSCLVASSCGGGATA